jgi:hypothetical protein
VDPKKLKVDPNTSLLLAANQAEIENPENQDPEKVLENPGTYSFKRSCATRLTLIDRY